METKSNEPKSTKSSHRWILDRDSDAISVSFFGYQTLQARDNADELASHSNAVISNIDEVLIGLINMETGLRGYLLTGNSMLLDHYNSGKNQYNVAIQQLSGLTKDNPELNSRWNTVETLARHWDNYWATKGIQIRKDVDAGKISKTVLSSHVIAERDESIMDDIRVRIGCWQTG